MLSKCKNLILRYAPSTVQKLLKDMYFAIVLLPAYAYDYGRFLAYSGSGLSKNRNSQSERAARITLSYHQIEKGLSLSSPRAGFGMTVIPKLLDSVDEYLAEYGIIEPATTAIAVLLDYLDYNASIEYQVDYVHNRLFTILDKYHVPLERARLWSGGILHLSRAELLTARNGGFKSFFKSRYSIRQYAGGTIPASDIRCAVELAQKTPSVCNRQSWRVHAFTDAKKMESLLKIQRGSQGFGEQASVILVLTCELRSFFGVVERYQSWVDGGMFAMSLCLALHDLGYGTCCLSWAKEPSTDKAMRVVTSIPPSQQIIMLVAVGILKNEFNVAHSYRPPVDQCIVFHDIM